MSVLKTELAKFYRAATFLNLPDLLINRLRLPEMAFLDYLEVELEEGKSITILGYESIHSRLRGPGKGGIRALEINSFQEAIEETDALAMLMTWKTAKLKLPYGGSKMGLYLIRSDPRNSKEVFPGTFPHDLSPSQQEGLFKHWTYRLKAKNAIGPEINIPAPDQNTGPRQMAWIRAAYNVDGLITTSSVTGKPVEIGGSLGRSEATGAGVYYVIADCLAPQLNFSLKGLKVVIQGFGNVAEPLVKYLFLAGAKIIAVSDINGGITNDKEGINPFVLAELKRKIPGEYMSAYRASKSADIITNQNLLELPCDLLIPAATSAQIHKDNAGRIRPRLGVVEAANSPITLEAADILRERGIRVFPAILLNGGGVIVSYLEWVQNLQSYFFKEETVHGILRELICESFNEAWEVSEILRISLEEAAMAVAVARLAQAAWWLGKDIPSSWTPSFPYPIDKLASNQKILKGSLVNEEVERERILRLIRQEGKAIKNLPEDF